MGYIAALAEQGPTRGPQNVFVNRRIVSDRTIAHAIIDAYSVASIKERSPEVHLFIEMPLDAVDVNVHPTKAEVRFRDQSFMHEVVRRALGDALGRGPAPELQLVAPPGWEPQPSTLPLPDSLFGTSFRVVGLWAHQHRHATQPCTAERSSVRTGRRSGIAPQRDASVAPTGYQADDAARTIPRHLHHRRRRGRASRSSISMLRTSASCSSGSPSG